MTYFITLLYIFNVLTTCFTLRARVTLLSQKYTTLLYVANVFCSSCTMIWVASRNNNPCCSLRLVTHGYATTRSSSLCTDQRRISCRNTFYTFAFSVSTSNTTFVFFWKANAVNVSLLTDWDGMQMDLVYPLKCHLLTYSTVQSPSWEANWFSASQQIPRISQNLKVHYGTHKHPPPVSILGQPNPVHIPTSHLLEICPDIIRPSTPRSAQWSPSLRFPHQHPIHPHLLTHTRHKSSPIHSSRFYLLLLLHGSTVLVGPLPPSRPSSSHLFCVHISSSLWHPSPSGPPSHRPSTLTLVFLHSYFLRECSDITSLPPFPHSSSPHVPVISIFLFLFLLLSILPPSQYWVRRVQTWNVTSCCIFFMQMDK